LNPFGVKHKLPALFPRPGDRHKIRAGSPAVNDLIRDAFVAEAEMAGRLVERRVDDRVFDHDLAH